MSLRRYITILLLAPLAGCVNLGASDVLVTPVGVAGVYHFDDSRVARDDTDRREAAVREALASLSVELHGEDTERAVAERDDAEPAADSRRAMIASEAPASFE